MSFYLGFQPPFGGLRPVELNGSGEVNSPCANFACGKALVRRKGAAGQKGGRLRLPADMQNRKYRLWVPLAKRGPSATQMALFLSEGMDLTDIHDFDILYPNTEK